MSDISVLGIALINAAILTGIAVLFLVIQLRGGPRPDAKKSNRNKVLMITLTIGFLVSAVIGVMISMTQSG